MTALDKMSTDKTSADKIFPLGRLHVGIVILSHFGERNSGLI